jgi:hypothetical protein
MRFVYYLAAIGHRGLDVKLNILAKNLNYIYSLLNTSFDIVVNCYNSEDVVYNFLQQFTFLNKKMFHNKPGVLTELFLTNPHNASLRKYDYILFMLDDVEIQELNLQEMINVKEKYKIEILSPKVINSTHGFMNSYASHILTINNALEVYCLLLKYKDFQRFLSVHTIENKWMWGADFLFGHFNIKTGVYNRSSVKHMLLPSKKNTNNAEKLMRAYLKDMNFYGTIKDIIAVKNIINLRTGTSSKAAVNNNNNDNDSGKLMQINFKNVTSHNTTMNRNFNSTPNTSSQNTSIKRAQTIDNNTLKLLGNISNKHTTDMNKVKYGNKVKYDKENIASKTSVNRKKVGASLGASLGTSLGTSLGASLGTSLGASLGKSLGTSLGASLGTSKTYTNKTNKFTINNLMH